MHLLARHIILAAPLTMLFGCASSPNSTDAPVSELPRTAISNDGVVLEIGFAEVSAFDDDWQTELWNELDEQHLPIELRQTLMSNGLRCGLAGEQLPEILRKALDANSQRAATSQAQRSIRRIHLRPGNRSEIVTTSNDRSMTVLLDDGVSVSGHQFHAAQAVFDIQACKCGAGRAKIELTPEIHFGDSKQRYVGKDGAFVLETQRDHQTFGSLLIASNLAPGQTLIITCDGPTKSLGGNFFVDSSGERQKLLLVRLAQAPSDDIFTYDTILGSQTQ